MSGCSYNDTCPRCDGEMQCYPDHKPHDVADGFCLECGYTYSTLDGQATLEEVNEQRLNFELEPLEKLCEPLAEWQKIYG